jgi:hypothetical protein
MAKLTQEEKGFLNMAGEFLVAGELNRRKIQSAVAYGTSKSADVWAFSPNSRRAVRIEVKTTRDDTSRWVIGNKPLNRGEWTADQFWVLVLLPKARTRPPKDDAERGQQAARYFVFTGEELGEIVLKRHQDYCTRYLEKRGTEFRGKGMPKMFLREAAKFEERWDKIQLRLADEPEKLSETTSPKVWLNSIERWKMSGQEEPCPPMKRFAAFPMSLDRRIKFSAHIEQQLNHSASLRSSTLRNSIGVPSDCSAIAPLRSLQLVA